MERSLSHRFSLQHLHTYPCTVHYSDTDFMMFVSDERNGSPDIGQMKMEKNTNEKAECGNIQRQTQHARNSFRGLSTGEHNWKGAWGSSLDDEAEQIRNVEVINPWDFVLWPQHCYSTYMTLAQAPRLGLHISSMHVPIDLW